MLRVVRSHPGLHATVVFLVREYLIEHHRGGLPADLTDEDRDYLSGLARDLESGAVIGWVSFDGGQYTGTVVCSGDGEVGRLWVRPAFRRTGFASMLLDAATTEPGWWMSVSRSNEPARALMSGRNALVAGIHPDEPEYDRWVDSKEVAAA